MKLVTPSAHELVHSVTETIAKRNSRLPADEDHGPQALWAPFASSRFARKSSLGRGPVLAQGPSGLAANSAMRA